MSQECYVAVDLDGTLAVYDGWHGIEHIGEPIVAMVNQVKQWIAQGITVKILTARIAHDDEHGTVKRIIQDWCEKHIGTRLDATATKTFGMICFFDDRAFNVGFNNGVISRDFKGLPDWAPLKKREAE